MSGSDNDAIRAYLEQMQRVIDQWGWAVQGMMKPTGLGGNLGVFYTVGLTVKGLPELTISGTEPDVAKGMLNLMASRAVEGRLVPGQMYRLGGLPPFEVEDLEPDRAKRRLVMAWNMYRARMSAQLVKLRPQIPGVQGAGGDVDG
jgi:hypothetical protein